MNIDVLQNTLNLTEQGYVAVAVKLDSTFDVSQLTTIKVEGMNTFSWTIDALTNTITFQVKATDILGAYLRNVRLTLYDKAQQIYLEAGK